MEFELAPDCSSVTFVSATVTGVPKKTKCGPKALALDAGVTSPAGISKCIINGDYKANGKGGHNFANAAASRECLATEHLLISITIVFVLQRILPIQRQPQLQLQLALW